MHRTAGFGKEIQHLHIQLFERMAAVHNQHQPDQLAACAQIVAQQRHPVPPHRFGHLRVAVARQIGHEMPVGQLEKIDVLRAPGRFRHIGQPHMVAQRVDGAGLARIGAADEGDFRARVGQVFQMVDRSEEFCVLK